MPENLKRLLVGEHASIREAMTAIDKGAVEIALVVDDDRRLLGAVTDGDIRRALLAGASLESQISTVVTRAPHTVGVGASRVEVLDIMKARAIEQIPVVDEAGRLVGLHVMREVVGVAQRDNLALILAGGKGTRLGRLTESTPKPMLPVAGRPILERLVLHLVGAGVRRVVISVGYLAEVIESHFGDGSGFGCDIEYVREDPETPLGTGGPMALLADLERPPKEPLLLVNGDLVTDAPIGAMFAHHERTGAMVTVAFKEHHHEVPFGVLEVEGDDLVGLTEKPIASWHVNAGLYVVDPLLIERIPGGTEYPVTDLIAGCLERNERVSAFEIAGEWHDVGRPEQLERARGSS